MPAVTLRQSTAQISQNWRVFTASYWVMAGMLAARRAVARGT